jgi:hypothetical protein
MFLRTIKIHHKLYARHLQIGEKSGFGVTQSLGIAVKIEINFRTKYKAKILQIKRLEGFVLQEKRASINRSFERAFWFATVMVILPHLEVAVVTFSKKCLICVYFHFHIH